MTTKLGDFTNLAKHYHHRAGYSDVVLQSIAKLAGKDIGALHVADVGAGTGKLTTQLFALKPASLIAVEPNDAMRAEGQKHTEGSAIRWLAGSAESTGLESQSADWILMGSSFHWVELEKGLAEFHRVLRPGGMFTAVWNPRDLSRSVLQSKIDSRIKEIVPELQRNSSGAEKVTKDWLSLLVSTGQFKDALQMEARHDELMSPERYMGIWDSVNDIQAQAGPKRWQEILDMIGQEIAGLQEIASPYITRAWTVWRV